MASGCGCAGRGLAFDYVLYSNYELQVEELVAGRIQLAWNGPQAISRGWRAVQQLQQTMDEGRRRRLAYIGFPAGEAAELSALHTRNFM